MIALLAICTQQQEEIHRLKEQVQGLKDEIARLKGHKPKPTIRPSTLEKGGGDRPEKARALALPSVARIGSSIYIRRSMSLRTRSQKGAVSRDTKTSRFKISSFSLTTQSIGWSAG